MSYQPARDIPRKGKPYFAIEFEPGENQAGWLCVAGIALGGHSPERIKASSYALDVVKGYFLARGRELQKGDPARVLVRMLDYINSKLNQQSRVKEHDFHTDLNLLACTEDHLCVVGTGGTATFLAHQGRAKKVMGDEAPMDLLGRGSGVRFSRLDSPVWGGDLVIMLSPNLAEFFGNRELSLILQKAGNPARAAALVNALAARRRMEGELVTLIWEVPSAEKGSLLSEVLESRAETEPALPSAEPLAAEHHAAEELEYRPQPVLEVGFLGRARRTQEEAASEEVTQAVQEAVGVVEAGEVAGEEAAAEGPPEAVAGPAAEVVPEEGTAEEAAAAGSPLESPAEGLVEEEGALEDTVTTGAGGEAAGTEEEEAGGPGPEDAEETAGMPEEDEATAVKRRWLGFFRRSRQGGDWEPGR